MSPSPTPQPVVALLSRAAIFLVVNLKPGAPSKDAARAMCGDLSALLRAVGFRDLDGRLSCVMGFGSDAWDALFVWARLGDFGQSGAVAAHRKHSRLDRAARRGVEFQRADGTTGSE